MSTKSNCSKVFRFQSSYDLDTPIFAPTFMDLVKKLNQNVNGVLLDPRGPNGYVPVLDTEIAIKNGTLDCAFTGLSYSVLQDSFYELFTSVPFGISADSYLSYLFEKGGVKQLNKKAEKDGLFFFPMCCLPPETGGWFQKEINSIDDFKGLNMRIYGLARNIVENLGVNPVFLPQTELIPSIEAGIIDAVEFSTIEIDAFTQLPQYMKYWYAPAWNQLSTVLYFVINLKQWQSLSCKQQNLIQLLLKENMYSNYISSNQNQITFLNKYQSQLRFFPDSVLQAMRASWEQWLDKPENIEIKKEHEKIKQYGIQYESYENIMKKPDQLL